MEQYLREFVNYQQDNWVQYLPIAECAANNQFSETIKTTPFMANYAYHLRFTIELNQLSRKKQYMNTTSTGERLHEIN